MIKFLNIALLLLFAAGFGTVALFYAPLDGPLGPWLAQARAAIGTNGAASDAQNYRYGQLTRGELVSSVSATGALAPVAYVLVGSQVSGLLKELRVDFNSEVKKDQIIALIDPVSFQHAVEMAEAEVGIQTSQLLKAKVALSDAEADLVRKATLVAHAAGSAVDRIKAEAARNGARAQLDNAVASLAKSEAALRQARTDLERTFIRSPVDGIVIQRNVEAGQTVAASLQAPTLFIIAQDLRDMQVNASIDESEIGKITQGQPVEFTVDAHPGKRFTGTVFQIRKQPQTVQNVVTYTVVVRAKNPELLLLPGMTASARFVVSRKSQVLRVPNAAFRFQSAGNLPAGGQGFIWVEGEQGILRVPVKIGMSDGTQTEISGDGLSEKTRVVTGVQVEKRSRSAGQRLIGSF